MEVGRRSLDCGASGVMFMPFGHPYLSDAGAAGNDVPPEVADIYHGPRVAANRLLACLEAVRFSGLVAQAAQAMLIDSLAVAPGVTQGQFVLQRAWRGEGIVAARLGIQQKLALCVRCIKRNGHQGANTQQADRSQRTPEDRMRLAKYPLEGGSENIHAGSGSPEGAHKGWITS